MAGDTPVLPDITPEMEAEWEARMKATGFDPDAPSQNGNGAGATLAQMLALPELLEDLWPGHVYLPPKIAQLEIVLPLAQAGDELFKEGDMLGGVGRYVDIVCTLARRVEGLNLVPVTPEEVKSTFDPEEIANIVSHMLMKQGLGADGPNAGGGRWTGPKTFQTSAATTPDTGSNTSAS